MISFPCRAGLPIIALYGVLSVSVLTFAATTHRGQVTFNGLPVPGATVTADQGGKKLSAITDAQGIFEFADLADGECSIEVSMPGFAQLKQKITIAPDAPPNRWELKLLSLAELRAALHPEISSPAPASTAAKSPVTNPPEMPPQTNPSLQSKKQASATAPEDDDSAERTADGLLINGSMNNGAASPFALPGAFGNNRFGGRQLYNGGVGFIFDNSALDAAPYSLAGQIVPKPAYDRITGLATFGGPLPLHVWKMPPFIFASYQWSRDNNVTTQSAITPTQAERSGIFSSSIIDPKTGAPFSLNTIPQNRMSSQALALLNLYPLPNVAGNSGYNYQVPIVSPTHQDALQTRWNKPLGRTNQVYGNFAFQSVRSTGANVFGFVDTSDTLGLNTGVNWSHRLDNDWFLNLGYQYSRLSNRITPYFANRVNISGEAGISGNNQDAVNWGPPALTFASGIASLSDAQSQFNRNQTSGVSYSMQWNHRNHNVTYGGDFRRRQFNSFGQQDPRGSLTFTGALTGSAFADFLLGIPDTVSIASGNPDKYFRESLFDAYAADDWRINSSLTLNAGLRWEYGAPITELRDRLVNLDIETGFTAVSPVVATSPSGALTGRVYPSSLVEPDKTGFEPRIGIAWRPLPGSSWIVRAGYGVYYDTSVYQTLATQMSQQPPLSKALSVQNTAAIGLTLANPFSVPSQAALNTFAVDPDFHVGYAQNWQLSVQRDLPGALQLSATYLGIKGTHALEAFLPNTFPIGATNPCPTGPAGFAYLTSGGNSTRQSAQLQLRRRLHSGFAGSLQYTFSKSIDDAAALGGLGTSQNGGAASSGPANAALPNLPNLSIAQNWLNPRGERGLSNFDQRHLLSLRAQYTSGMGMAGGTLLSGRLGALAKDWTISTQISAGTGLPQTPVYLAAVPGTGVTGTIRPDYTGAPLYTAPAGSFLNPAAFAAPAAGQWGNAGRNSITGPATFTLNSSLGRTFRLKDRFSLDYRLDATNTLNHVTYTSWNTVINNAQFGLPVSANAMRSLQSTLRVRF